MESGDPFEGAGGGTADPFENDGSDLEPSTATAADEVAATPPADVPPADTPAADDVTEGAPPIVDREGVVQEAPAGPPATATAAGRAKLGEQAAEGAQEAAGGAEAATAAPEAPETETGSDGGADEPPQDPPAPADAPPPPAEPEGAKKGETRLYKLLYQTGPTTWEEADLANVADDLKQYTATDDGDTFLKARNNDHARRIAWAVMKRPEQGVTVELVARTSWKPKKLSTAPPEPSRERLVIS